jgi:hypothetical protein
MVDRNAMIDEAAGVHAEAADNGHYPQETLEQRVHRLEDAVAALQDMQLVEERITERVLERVHAKPDSLSTGIVDAQQLAHPSTGPALLAGSEMAADSPRVRNISGGRSWVIVEAFRELRIMFRMFFDSRYRVSWSAFFALMVLAYILVSKWLWSLWGAVPILGMLTGPMHLTFIGEILDKAVDLILALLAYKTLSREMRRYRETISSYGAETI